MIFPERVINIHNASVEFVDKCIRKHHSRFKMSSNLILFLLFSLILFYHLRFSSQASSAVGTELSIRSAGCIESQCREAESQGRLLARCEETVYQDGKRKSKGRRRIALKPI